MAIVEKTKSFFSKLFRLGAAVAAAGPTIKLVGNLVAKAGTTVANPNAAAGMTKAGTLISKVGGLVSGKVKAAAIKGGTAVGKGTLAVAKTLPGSKYLPIIGKIGGLALKVTPPLALAGLGVDSYHIVKDGLAGARGDLDARARFMEYAPILGGPDFGIKLLGAMTARYTRKTHSDRDSKEE